MAGRPSPPRLDHEPIENDDAEPSPLVARFGIVVAGGVAAALVSAVPAELRMGDGGSALRAMEQWIGLAAIAAPFAVALVAVFRRARSGVKIVAGTEIGLLTATVLWCAVIELGFLSVVGTVLRAKTHHRALGGVTFALVAVVSVVCIGVLAMRGAKMLAKAGRSTHRVAVGVAASCAFVALILVGMRTARADGLQTASALVDVLGLSVACAFASTGAFSRLRAMALVGVPALAVVIALGLSAFRADAALRFNVETQAPLHAWFLSVIGKI